MTKARGRARRELEQVGADPAKDDTEGKQGEDTILGRGRHGWWDQLLKRLRKT